jgi:hypothetical protein
MKRIIEGKVYNTETAEKIASYHNGYSCSDFKYCEESLYRTKKGAWFIAVEGGALSKYATPYGNATSGGDGLEPVSKEDARQWLEDHECTDALEEHFADTLEDA